MSHQMELFPPIPLQEWDATKQTLHRFLQIVGKVRLEHAPRRNHWWHVPFHLTGSGLTTRPMGLHNGNPVFTIDLDLVSHRLTACTLGGAEASFGLADHSVAAFYRKMMGVLADLDLNAQVSHPYPYDLPDASRPFSEDTEHAAYDPAAANRYWRVLSQVGLVLEAFAAGYSGKTSPVHHFWHTLDIAVTRFNDQIINQPRSAGALVREAYSRDVVSFGFWFGDDTAPEPAFYSYAAPEPDGLTGVELPGGAKWTASGHGHLALLTYAQARAAADPVQAVLDFYEAAYQGSARLLGWDIAALTCPHGATDPYFAGRAPRWRPVAVGSGM